MARLGDMRLPGTRRVATMGMLVVTALANLAVTEIGCGSSTTPVSVGADDCSAACATKVTFGCGMSCDCSRCAQAPASCFEALECQAGAATCAAFGACVPPPADCAAFRALCPIRLGSGRTANRENPEPYAATSARQLGTGTRVIRASRPGSGGPNRSTIPLTSGSAVIVVPTPTFVAPPEIEAVGATFLTAIV